jgi:hypothetical protein
VHCGLLGPPLRESKVSVAAERRHLQRCIDGGDDRPSISLEAEVPEVLFEGLREFIQANPEWDQYRVITSALATFLFQNGCNETCVTEHYLDGLFPGR